MAIKDYFLNKKIKKDKNKVNAEAPQVEVYDEVSTTKASQNSMVAKKQITRLNSAIIQDVWYMNPLDTERDYIILGYDFEIEPTADVVSHIAKYCVLLDADATRLEGNVFRVAMGDNNMSYDKKVLAVCSKKLQRYGCADGIISPMGYIINNDDGELFIENEQSVAERAKRVASVIDKFDNNNSTQAEQELLQQLKNNTYWLVRNDVENKCKAYGSELSFAIKNIKTEIVSDMQNDMPLNTYISKWANVLGDLKEERELERY